MSVLRDRERRDKDGTAIPSRPTDGGYDRWCLSRRNYVAYLSPLRGECPWERFGVQYSIPKENFPDHVLLQLLFEGKTRRRHVPLRLSTHKTPCRITDVHAPPLLVLSISLSSI